tara:strand:- start:5530 stop:5763 length:234 start_codon:yes stop_codon:yes gene_type:complete
VITLTIAYIETLMYDNDFYQDEASDYWYEAEMEWRHDHPIQAKWGDFTAWCKYVFFTYPMKIKNLFTTGKFEEDLPF